MLPRGNTLRDICADLIKKLLKKNQKFDADCYVMNNNVINNDKMLSEVTKFKQFCLDWLVRNKKLIILREKIWEA